MSLRRAVVNRLKRNPTSLRAEVIRQQRGAAPTPDPLTRTGNRGKLQDAIEFRQRVAFQYSNEDEPRRSGRRIGLPHGVFKRQGRTYLLLYAQPGSVSASGRLPGWRTYLLGRVSNVQILRQETPTGKLREFTIAPGFARFRRLRFIFRV